MNRLCVSLTGVGIGLAMGMTAAAVSTPVTFNKEVLPILQENFQGCHRPGELAPMSSRRQPRDRAHQAPVCASARPSSGRPSRVQSPISRSTATGSRRRA